MKYPVSKLTSIVIWTIAGLLITMYTLVMLYYIINPYV
jgi:hypothetical protein